MIIACLSIPVTGMAVNIRFRQKPCRPICQIVVLLIHRTRLIRTILQSGTAPTDSGLDKALLVEIHGDVDALQEQLNEYEHRLRFRDILGGIGFIVGIIGAAYGYYYRGLLRKNACKTDL